MVLHLSLFLTVGVAGLVLLGGWDAITALGDRDATALTHDAAEAPPPWVVAEIQDYTSALAALEQAKRERHAYVTRLEADESAAPPPDVFNVWQRLEPFAMRYKFTFDYAYGFPY